MPALPTVGGSSGTWGTELNAFLNVAHNADGTQKRDNSGGVINVKDYGAVGNGFKQMAADLWFNTGVPL